jgi:hypothetical protein
MEHNTSHVFEGYYFCHFRAQSNNMTPPRTDLLIQAIPLLTTHEEVDDAMEVDDLMEID